MNSRKKKRLEESKKEYNCGVLYTGAPGTNVITPQYKFTDEIPEWHLPLLNIKSTKTVLKKSCPSGKLRPKQKPKGCSTRYLEMIEKRHKFCTDINVAFKVTTSNEEDAACSPELSLKEKEWLKYEYYLRKLIPTESVAPLSEFTQKRILKLVPHKLKVERPLDLEEMIEQIKEEYIRTIKKAAGTL